MYLSASSHPAGDLTQNLFQRIECNSLIRVETGLSDDVDITVSDFPLLGQPESIHFPASGH